MSGSLSTPLAECLRQSSNLKSLGISLGGNDMTVEQAETILPEVPTCSGLERLVVRDMAESEASSFARCIQECTNLEDITIHLRNVLSVNSLREVCESASMLSLLRQLNIFRGVCIVQPRDEEEAVALLGNLMAQSQSLTHLTVNGVSLIRHTRDTIACSTPNNNIHSCVGVLSDHDNMARFVKRTPCNSRRLLGYAENMHLGLWPRIWVRANMESPTFLTLTLPLIWNGGTMKRCVGAQAYTTRLTQSSFF